MTDGQDAKKLQALRARYRKIEAPRSLTAAVLTEAEATFDAGRVTRWPWLTAGAVAVLATILIVPVYFSEDTAGTRKETDLKVPSLSALQGQIPAVPNKAVPGLSGLSALPPVTVPSIPAKDRDPKRSPRSNSSSDISEYGLTYALQMEVRDDEQAQI